MKKIIILSLLAVSFAACKKEKQEGYQGFWFNALTSYNLDEMANVSNLTLYVDEEFISTVDVSEYKISTPGCKEGQFLYIDKLNKKEKKEHSFKIVDQNNTTFWKGKFESRGNVCRLIHLSF